MYVRRLRDEVCTQLHGVGFFVDRDTVVDTHNLVVSVHSLLERTDVTFDAQHHSLVNTQAPFVLALLSPWLLLFPAQGDRACC